jgi:hypothetical protein
MRWTRRAAAAAGKGEASLEYKPTKKNRLVLRLFSSSDQGAPKKEAT